MLQLCGFEITNAEADFIAAKIYQNECSSKTKRLVWWNEGEEFASLGIGHFIWYPEGKRGLFEETFPSLIAYFSERKVKLPDWLQAKTPCPWKSKEDFLKENAQKNELLALLLETIPLQAAFLAKRFEEIAPRLSEYEERIARVASSKQGKYALLDYANFKGSGLVASESYHGQGWGLKQVLETMADDRNDPVAAFALAAQTVLEKRVQNAPEERNEKRWLPGWTSRVKSYCLSK